MISDLSLEKTLPIVWNDEASFAAKFIAFNPVFWNIAAQLELRVKLFTKLGLGNRYYGCYILAAIIFSLGIYRDWIYRIALESQPVAPLLDNIYAKVGGAAMFGVGNVLVLSSMWALGITGTYLGDYFGILMDERIASFPFNVCNNPMYIGCYLSFLGVSLWYGKALGFVLSTLMWVMYMVALRFEEPYTERIYSDREKAREAAAESSGSSTGTSRPSTRSRTKRV
ncbi:Phosphatidyl-N-methylethanolamine N-methyltransferase [Wickerhamiella sorbophila]|uniref:Phosphatidyl-N-methylethanolamine N-methyltransferase n=1 Tax=Wickerhamiella sorbophila TaxID=45607 RepID=A0A2T0FKC7_9ASCO|nr:Phosphatidyl-N-methylethanolamine N-methyltransferase [Wickerhamiella sorbophila]PRT55429.1 Phosphatidyl-N-methylethanolamine N-methyltransferase [Wickerhamiella sorbophila]